MVTVDFFDETNVPSVRSQDFKRVNLIGRGRYCKVYSAAGPSSFLSNDSQEEEVDEVVDTQIRRPPSLVAIKCIDPSKIQNKSKLLAIAMGELTNEARVLSQLNHTNIVRLLGICLESDSLTFGEESDFMVFEVLRETLGDRLKKWRREKQLKEQMYVTKNNSLRSMMSKLKASSASSLPCMPASSQSSVATNSTTDSSTRPAPEERMRRMHIRVKNTVLGIVNGLVYLHSKEIVLRDLKPDNVGYVDSPGIKYGTVNTSVDDCDQPVDLVRLFDFGMAKNVELCDPREVCGSLRYMAPEVMKGEGYSLKVDVYSFGVLLFEMCSLISPFTEDLNSKKKNKMKKRPKKNFPRGSPGTSAKTNGKLDDFCERFLAGEISPYSDLEKSVPCPQLRDIIEECCGKDPTKRPTIIEIQSRLNTIFSVSMDDVN